MRLDHVVSIEPEGKVAGRSRERRISGCREIIDPWEIKDPCAEGARDIARSILAAGIHNHDFIEEPADRFEAMRDIILLVAPDHG